MGRNRKTHLLFLYFVLFFATPFSLFAIDGWKKVAVTKESDLWYVDQTIGYSSRGKILSSRARLKFVPAGKSMTGQDIKNKLLTDGVDSERFRYFIEYVEIDCKKNLFTVSGIDFFDEEDVKFFGRTFAEPEQYASPRDSAYELIAQDLCQNRPGLRTALTAFENTLKTKKPFLYFYP